MRKAVQLEPEFAEAHAGLGRALATLGDIHRAVKHRELGAATDKDGSIHFQLFQLYRRLGNNEQSQHARARALALRNSHAEQDEQ